MLYVCCVLLPGVFCIVWLPEMLICWLPVFCLLDMLYLLISFVMFRCSVRLHMFGYSLDVDTCYVFYLWKEHILCIWAMKKTHVMYFSNCIFSFVVICTFHVSYLYSWWFMCQYINTWFVLWYFPYVGFYIYQLLTIPSSTLLILYAST